ncbi:MAG: glycosyltransferase family 2 protein [Acidobacteria bacterium]|nr:glycosyltransferase family 2 protein [Acidobacteriota bacterium]
MYRYMSLTVTLSQSLCGDIGVAQLSQQLDGFAGNPCISRILILHQGAAPQRSVLRVAPDKAQFIQMDSWFSGAGVERLLEASDTDGLLLILPGSHIEVGQRGIERFLAIAEDTGAGFVYSDFREMSGGQLAEHPTIAYQLGSLRDTFDFGPLVLVSKRAADQALSRHGRIESTLGWAGLYDLRLKISADFPIVRIPESLYITRPLAEEQSASGGVEKIHEYVDPRNREYQLEMEQVATAHLRRIGAFLEPSFSLPPPPEGDFPVMASIIIPVRNREKTIAEAVHSALSQATSFPYNIIVVDNHSTDGTTEVLRQLAQQHETLIHKIPRRTDLGIGGCWNEAIYSLECGLYAVQLDSDDLYIDAHTLEKIINKFLELPSERRGAIQTVAPHYPMVIGSYKTVNFDLEEIPPGLIDHREWTRENGRNNALRILGLGAPRAFYVPVLRRYGFPNVSYGEDYAISLRISRDYEIGRIYEPLYLARRWEGNTDRALPLAVMNRYDAYKDWLRTVEIQARMNLRHQAHSPET